MGTFSGLLSGRIFVTMAAATSYIVRMLVVPPGDSSNLIVVVGNSPDQEVLFQVVRSRKSEVVGEVVVAR